MIHFDLDHYFARSSEWFNFMLKHPEKRTRHLLVKLYNRYMLTATHFYLLHNNID